MAEEEELIITCPHCLSRLGFDDTGTPFTLEPPALEPGEQVGVGGIRTIEADPRWLQTRYLFGQGKQTPTLSDEQINALLKPEGAPAIEIDQDTQDKITAAVLQDLKDRGILNPTTDPTEQ